MMRLRSISIASALGAALLLPVALRAQTYTIATVNPASVASNAAGATLTLTGTLPTNLNPIGGYGYCFYTGSGSTTPITPTSTNPTVISVPASTINLIPPAAFTNGVFNAKLYVIAQPVGVGAAVNCTGVVDNTLSNTATVPVIQVPTLASFDVEGIPVTNAATGIQPPPLALTFTGTGLIGPSAAVPSPTTVNYTWIGGAGTGTVKYGSGTTLVATVPATVPSTVTSIQATACNQTVACSAPLLIGLTALTSSGGTLTATPNPATVQQAVTLLSTFAPGPNALASNGAPSGTVTFTNGATTLGTAKLVLDKTTATLKNPGSITLSGAPATTFYTADFNGDGIPDVVYVDTQSPALIHVDLGDTPYGTFQVDRTYAMPGVCAFFNSLATGDLNGDGFADLVFDCLNGSGTVFVYAMLSNGDGTFAAPVQVSPVLGTQVALKDMNKDGKLDLVVAGRAIPNPCAANCNGFVLFTGNGDGTFTVGATTTISGAATSNLLLADIDGDGYPDIVELNNLSMATQSIDVYLSKNATSFGTAAPPIFTPSYSIPLQNYPILYKFLFTGDFNGDGLPDLGTVLTPSGTASVVTALNTSKTGTASFAAPTGLPTGVAISDIASADINGDGLSDLLITTSANNAVFLEADGKGSFANSYTGLSVPAGTVLDMQAADLNGDGYADAVVLAPGPVGGAVTYKLQGFVTNGSANAALNTTFAQSGTAALSAAWPGNINFSGSTGKLNLTVNAASSSTSLGTSGTPSVYGQPVTFSSTVTSTTATGTPTGTITFKDGSVPLGGAVAMVGGSASFTLSTLTAGSHFITALYSGDNVFTASVSGTTTQVVNQAQPVVTWNPVPTNITYGTTLVAGQLNATAASTYFPTVAGSFNYNPPLGTQLGAGPQTLNVTFTPTDAADYKTAIGTANITVAKFTPIITWNAPTPIVVGTPLSGTQLNASATGVGPSLFGGYTYTPPAGTLLAAGANQPLSVLFTPMDLTDYNTATGNTNITVIPLALTLVAPNTATVGSAATPITLSGTGFLPNSVVNVNGTPLATYAYVNATTMTATIPVSYLSTAQVLNLTVFDPTQNQTSGAATFTVGAPPVVAVLTGPSTTQPAQQPALSFALTNPYPLPLTGTLTLTFSGVGGANDPAIQFAGGGRTATFSIPANTTATPSFQLQSGTDAGTITVTLVLTAAAQVVTPANIVPLQIVLPPAPPVITSMTLTRSANILTVNIIGYSDTRDMAQAAFEFTPASGQTISDPEITLPAAVLFSTWYSAAPSQAYGSNFMYSQTFDLSADQSTIGSVTVTLTNSAGASASATAD
jgi:hypothetical protein